ncbi:hypothetical protein ACWESM_18620 [Nocardia sp. NPDC003999]
MTDNGTSWLVNGRTGKRIGPFTTRTDALLALAIAEDASNWRALSRDEFDAHLESVDVDELLGDAQRGTGDDYAVRPDGRVPVWVMLTVGDQAHCVTPWHTHDAPLILSAQEIGSDAGIPAGEVIGREFTAAGSESEALHDFRLVHDPRL